MDSKETIQWLAVFIVGSLIVSAIVSPSTFDSLKDSISKLSKNAEGKIDEVKTKVTNSGYSNLDVVENPLAYVGQEIFLKDAYLCFINGIVAYREDGTRNVLKFTYERDINEWYVYDLYGVVEEYISTKKDGYIEVDNDGNPRNAEYSFNVTRAVQKKYITEYEFRHANNIAC